MAKLINPLLSQDARGSVSGIQFSRNRSGNFGSRKSTSNRSQSETATNHRAYIKLAHTFWLSLAPALKTAWHTVAPHPLTGRNAFVGAAIRNLTMGLAPPHLNPMLFTTPNHLRNITWDAEGDVAGHNCLKWEHDGWEETYVIVYISQPRGFTMPHVHKFRYYAHPELMWVKAVIDPPWISKPAALRIVHWSRDYGRLIQEFRYVFDHTQDQTFVC